LLGLYLKDNHLIHAGKKTAIAAATPRLTPGPRELIVKQEDGSYSVVGRVTLGAAQTVTADEFDACVKEHLVSKPQRLQWWPQAETLTLFPLTYSALATPQLIDLAPGTTQDVELQGLGLKEIDVVEGQYIYELD